MNFRNWIFNSLLKESFLVRVLDAIFFYSPIKIEQYFRSMELDRRIKSIKSANRSLGIGYPKGNIYDAEIWFIDKVLSELLQNRDNLILVDIGANVGDYSNMLKTYIPKSVIYCCEPNPFTFSILSERFARDSSIKTFNFGLADFKGESVLYTHGQKKTSAHSSLIKGVIQDIYNDTDVLDINVSLTTLDDFLMSNNLDNVDFLKIDTEGFEYSIFNGGLESINSNKISMIQFEFNEMNVFKKVFLNDFIKILSNYLIFRISEGELIDISVYKTEYEVFWYQDIFCVLKDKHDYVKKLKGFLAK